MIFSLTKRFPLLGIELGVAPLKQMLRPVIRQFNLPSLLPLFMIRRWQRTKDSISNYLEEKLKLNGNTGRKMAKFLLKTNGKG